MHRRRRAAVSAQQAECPLGANGMMEQRACRWRVHSLNETTLWGGWVSEEQHASCGLKGGGGGRGGSRGGGRGSEWRPPTKSANCSSHQAMPTQAACSECTGGATQREGQAAAGASWCRAWRSAATGTQPCLAQMHSGQRAACRTWPAWVQCGIYSRASPGCCRCRCRRHRCRHRYRPPHCCHRSIRAARAGECLPG